MMHIPVQFILPELWTLLDGFKRIFVNCICLARIVVTLRVFVYLICICGTLYVFVVPYVYL